METDSAPGRVRRQGAERSRMHGHMYSDSLGAAAGFAPERSSLTGGVPSVSNAGVVGGVIYLAAVLRVAHVRLRPISEIKKKNQNPKLSNSLNRSLRSTHTQDLR